MLIMTQNGKSIVNTNTLISIYILRKNGLYGIYTRNIATDLIPGLLGEYGTYEQAKDVLNDIFTAEKLGEKTYTMPENINT